MNGLKMQMYMKQIPMYKVAEKIGIHPKTLRTWLKNCNGERYNKIINAINELEKVGVSDDY